MLIRIQSIKQAYEVSARNNDSVGSWSRGRMCHFQSTLYPYLRTFYEAEMKDGGLINQAEEILRQDNVHTVA